ncbi:hypothetical protein G3I34_06745 [Streptomyces sp. SID8014]|uniref:hypothetical protein n=1 Tax=Streptomyces sp. SID8014 TaxID=2706097 RepID=UPI0013BB7FF3|nr:hypothetical protein [Streptomyces sp. SID8014]NEC11994.1 hypothetical protein [Streptomyces sp. SID8014]
MARTRTDHQAVVHQTVVDRVVIDGALGVKAVLALADGLSPGCRTGSSPSRTTGP